MKRIFLLIVGILFVAFLSVSNIFAQELEVPDPTNDKYYKAKVVEIIQDREKVSSGVIVPYQIIKAQILEGERAGDELIINHGETFSIREDQKVDAGDVIVLTSFEVSGEEVFVVRDAYRLDSLISIVVLFLIVVIVVAGFKGLGSIIGLLVSLLVILKFIVPQILAGHDPVLVSIAGSFFIMFVTIYLAHGFSKKTSVAVASTFISLSITGILAILFVSATKLTGLGEEGAFSLQFGPTQVINLKGLLLGGIIIGALGVLDDVTTTQAAAIFELKGTDKNLRFTQLLKKGYAVGKEHIASVVNTLVLAYAGASMIVFIFFIFNPANIPLWVLLNGELIASEVVRTLAGSIGLVLAVPITTILASWIATRYSKV